MVRTPCLMFCVVLLGGYLLPFRGKCWDYFGINNNPKKSKHGTRMYPDKILPRRPCTGWKGSWEGTFAPGADLGAGVNPVYEISMPSGSVPDARK